MTKALLGEGDIVATLDHPLDDTDLAGRTVLALGDMLIRLSKVFAVLLYVWHGLPIIRLIARTSHVIRRSGVMVQKVRFVRRSDSLAAQRKRV